MRHARLLVILSLLLFCKQSGWSAPEEGGTAIEMIVRGPDGRVVVDKNVELIGTLGDHRDAPTRASARTDADGKLRVRWSSGVDRITIHVPEIGYASTGLVDVSPGEVAVTVGGVASTLALVVKVQT